MESAVSSSAAMSFRKWLAVSCTYQNGSSIKPTAITGARKKLPSTMAIEAPMPNRSSEQAQSREKCLLRPVMVRISCAMRISRFRNPCFWRRCAALISSLMEDFSLVRKENSPSVNSIGASPNNRKEPVIMPIQASN